MKDLLCGCLIILLSLLILVAGLEFLWKGKNWVAKHMKFFLLTSFSIDDCLLIMLIWDVCWV